jgi:predicted Zn-dependent protease with MMP-like domain
LIEMSAERFEELVAEALDTIPEELAARMENVAVFVQARSRIRGLLGLYQGVPLTARGNHYGIGGGQPDRITIFREPILARCRSEAQVVEQVRITVVHEVAHHFGIDDGRLHELGYG